MTVHHRFIFRGCSRTYYHFLVTLHLVKKWSLSCLKMQILFIACALLAYIASCKPAFDKAPVLQIVPDKVDFQVTVSPMQQIGSSGNNVVSEQQFKRRVFGHLRRQSETRAFGHARKNYAHCFLLGLAPIKDCLPGARIH